MTPAWDRTRPGVCDSEKLVRVGGFMAGVRRPVHATDAVADTKLMDMGPVDPYVSPTNGLGSWIWASNTYDGRVCQFWRAFEVPISSTVTNARLTVTADNEFTLYLDTTGEPLFKRGQRISTGEAPLRENLAAGIIRLAGWAPGIPLLDPMCGSGTILLEAAHMALDIAPGLGRGFAFEKFKNFDSRLWRDLLRQSRARQKPRAPLAIYGSDLAADVLKAARANLMAAGLEKVVSLKRADVLETAAPAQGGIIVTNPPYGIRLGEQQAMAEFYPKLGDVLKKQFSGWRAYLLSADMRLPKLIHLAASKRTPLFNGALECRLFEYKMVEGEMRKKKAGV